MAGEISSVSAAPPVKPGPEIFSITPAEGPAGETIELKGSELANTRDVLFISGRIVKKAQFKQISDTELKVTAPPFLRGEATATVVVVTRAGVAVGMPPSVNEVDKTVHGNRAATAFNHVLKDGVVNGAGGLVFVEEGGTAVNLSRPAACFVRKGGTISDVDALTGIVFYESGAVLKRSGSIPNRNQNDDQATLIAVRSLTASPGIAPFIFRTPEPPPGQAQSAPKIKSLSPAAVSAGDLVTLRGSGFLETSEIWMFFSAKTEGHSAAYRIVSDNQLDLEVPEDVVGPCGVVVVNPKGATLVIPKSDVVPYSTEPSGTRERFVVSVVGAGTIVEANSFRYAYFVEKGGLVAKIDGTTVFFIKGGGKLTVRRPPGHIFYETDADLGADANKANPRHHAVDSLNVSHVNSRLVIRK